LKTSSLILNMLEKFQTGFSFSGLFSFRKPSSLIINNDSVGLGKCSKIYVFSVLIIDVQEKFSELINKCASYFFCRCVMSQSSQKLDVIWLHTMNFITAGNVWVCHTLVICFGDDVMWKWNVYMSIQERYLWNM
jgi:hypothetical protein